MPTLSVSLNKKEAAARLPRCSRMTEYLPDHAADEINLRIGKRRVCLLYTSYRAMLVEMLEELAPEQMDYFDSKVKDEIGRAHV